MDERTRADVSETRRRAWETRRQKYGASGHAGAYTRPCARCRSMQALIVRLHREGVLSEGRAAKATGLDRVELRRLADDAPAVGAAQGGE